MTRLATSLVYPLYAPTAKYGSMATSRNRSTFVGGARFAARARIIAQLVRMLRKINSDSAHIMRGRDTPPSIRMYE